MRYAVLGAVLFFGMPVLLLAPLLGMLVDPWAPFRFQGTPGELTVSPPAEAQPFDPGTIPVVHGGVTDSFRWQLARASGFSPAEAIIAVAISIAEDGSGDPAAMSPKNKNGTFDLGLWQINSAHWPAYGGKEALIDPLNNARAAHAIYASAGWCSWSTYETSCGVGYTGAYRAYLSRAQAASQVAPIGA